MKSVKIKLPEPFQVCAIIAKLPPTWKCYRKRVLHRREDYSLEGIQKHLHIEEKSRLRDKSEETNFGPSRERVNAVNKFNHYKSNNQKRGNSQKENFLGPKKGQGKFKNNNKGDCFVCGKLGHFARYCRFRKKQNEMKINAIEEEIIATVSEINDVQGKIQGWWYDTCATVYVSYDMSLFKTFDELRSTQEIPTGNENHSKVLDK